MRVLALSKWSDFKALGDLFSLISCDVIRPPESGLIMLRGRVGGSGDAFNIGEATATRCAVRSAKGHEGHAYIMGRNHAHAKLAAICDALMQDENYTAKVESLVIEPLQKIMDERRHESAQKTAATKVDFFTLVRGEND
jgi:alpha-D-ribose 1-methylphosphonate 5-triphosphate synthase subunit PhnG